MSRGNQTKQPLFPKQTMGVLILLAIIAIVLWLLRLFLPPLTPPPQNYQQCLDQGGSISSQSCTTQSGREFTNPNPPTIAPLPTPSPTSPPAPYTNPDTGWLIHRLDNLVIQLPSNWYDLSTGTQISFSNLQNPPTSQSYSQNSSPSGALTIDILSTTNELELKAAIDQELDTARRLSQNQLNPRATPTTLDGFDAYRITGNLPGFAIYSSTPTPGQIIQIAFTLDVAANQTLINQIIDTIAFLPNACNATCPSLPTPQTCPSSEYIYQNFNNCYCPASITCLNPSLP